MAKYDALRAHLESLPAATRTVTMRFAELDAIVGGLPPTARTTRQWWANNSQVHAMAWRAAGWHVDRLGVDFNAGWVRFARGKVGGTMARRLGRE